jgi:hypothetical protein
MSDQEPQFSERELRMAQLGAELRLGNRLLARAIASFGVIPLVFFILPRHYFWIMGGVFAFAGLAYLALGLKHRRSADRGLLEIDKAN